VIDHRIDQCVCEIVAPHEPRIPSPFAEPLPNRIEYVTSGHFLKSDHKFLSDQQTDLLEDQLPPLILINTKWRMTIDDPVSHREKKADNAWYLLLLPINRALCNCRDPLGI
jgi:hypothetical protein